MPKPKSTRLEAVRIDRDLTDLMAELYDKPLEFVQIAYEWDQGDLLGFKGPDKWQKDFLKYVGDSVRERGFDGVNAVSPIRVATTSGHGIGKSALTAWLIQWIMSTRPHCKGVVTANTAPQLETKTWAENAKWLKRLITGHWFEVTNSRGNMRMVHHHHPETWRVDAQTCREENSESFAGLHAANSTPFYIFDEASAVPNAIWEVAEGGLTDGEPMIFVFGNPTRNSGKFFDCFNTQSHRWHNFQIDSRKASMTNKGQIKEWIEDYGLDSDFVRVRVRGEFPRAGDAQFISSDSVFTATQREIQVRDFADQPKIMGVDVARFGEDQTVITIRQGYKLLDIKKYRGLDTMEVASKVVDLFNQQRPDAVCVDGIGVGAGVVDRLKQMKLPVHDVVVSNVAEDQKAYANVRAELWGRMRDWLQYADIPLDNDLFGQLTGLEYGFNHKMQIILEKKSDVKKRGLDSPDIADSLALTFYTRVSQRAMYIQHNMKPVRAVAWGA